MAKNPAPRRAAAQQLASLRAAGVTRVSRSTRVASEPPAVVSPANDAPQNIPTPTIAVSVDTSLFDTKASGLPRAEREDRLRAIAARVALCTRCQELARTRTQTVFGVGNPEAEIMFVGEAPGADEDRHGEPFVGAAGQLLNRILEASRLKRSDVYICNILRCRPPGNRNPLPDEAANCREYLDGQIELVDPDYIVCLGSVAAKNLLGLADSIGKLRGRILQYGRAKVVCTYHPAYLLRNPAAKKDVWDDMKFLMRDRGIDLSSP
ncbi:MAG TPA: uracil-DNA glycosylase [Planctomycetaceae bacterium]|jgi:DNA polymerase|nr:uracil-DNA glycosylase [Planctomycetaceae bacterium]